MALSSRSPITQIPSFDLEQMLQKWAEAYATNAGELKKALRGHWSTSVPNIFCRGYDPEKEQRHANTFLFYPLERFVCGEEPSIKFQKLKDLDAPSQICGHVFRSGEPTYSCRDCANDPTCVLCINCFQKSKHKNHKYRMSTSGGGGYCDCGDPEAWKSEPFCDAHRGGPGQGDQDPVKNLPSDLKGRASTVFLALFGYILELLTWDRGDQLPEDLQPEGELSDECHCMLFNDEVHTYDQVISTLQRAIECTNRQAIDYATIVDREGRTSVRQGAAANCEKAKEVIERSTSRHGSKPLKVMVMHNILVAHQTFALRSIEWLQTVTNKTDGLRRLFCLLSMEPIDSGLSLMEHLILSDTQLWKVARTMSHQLLMSGVLKDSECKKQFAVIFTKHYPQMSDDFIADDHDHEVSVCSLSVQIFTVPSLARMLIAEHDLLSVILNVFLKTCNEKKNDKGKLSFERNERTASFKRASYMLYDLKYALICKPSEPSEWTDHLRNSFLKGFITMLNLLKLMQGMDAVTRQTTQHLEFEPEWEGAFNLQLKMEYSLVLFAEWCAADRYLLIKAYQEVMKYLYQNKEKLSHEKVSVYGHTAKCIKYDVSSQPVSIHIPITRFLASIYVDLADHGLGYNSPEFDKNRMDVVELMELPLRVQVMIAQTQSGMWRRNGFSLLNQIYFYHNVKCREEMYNKDIVLLQIAASLLDPNEFLIHLLNRFGLIPWTKHDYDSPVSSDDSVRQTVTLAEEFLTLLIIIIEERYVPGVGEVTQKDAVKREIIHQLCIAPMPHSKLAKGLPENPNHETGLEEVVEEVATFKKPVGGGNGKYELKEQYYAEYCPFFYHYSRTDQSKSEDAERTRKKQAGEDQALPPPVPPKFRSAFRPIVNLLCCDVMIELLSLVLSRTAAARSRSWSEAQFERVLYLIGLALQEQIQVMKSGSSEAWMFPLLEHTVGEGRLLSMLEGLVQNANVSQEPIKDLLTWVLRKYGEALQMSDEPTFRDQLEHLAKCADLRTQTERKKKAAIAAKRRAKVMAQISKMQKDFIAENAELFENTHTDTLAAASEMDVTFPVPDSVALGPVQTQNKQSGSFTVMCILCQEEETISKGGRVMVLAAYVQMSTVLSQNRKKHLANGEQYDPLLMSADLFNGTHTSSCGHAMHHDCWQRFFQNIVNKERRRPVRFRHSSSYDVDKMEYLCPLCEGLSNTVIPIIPYLPSLLPDTESKEVQIEFDDWLDGIHKTAVNSVQNKEIKGDFHLLLQPCPISTITRMMAESVARNFQLLWDYVSDDASGSFSESMREMMQKFARDVYVFGLGVKPDDENARVPVMAWNTCAYTIMSFEQNLAYDGVGIFGSLTERQSALLGALIRVAATISQVVKADTIREHCVKLLSLLIPEKVEALVFDSDCFLDVDMFHFLVALTMTLPSLQKEGGSEGQSAPLPIALASVPTGGLNDQYCLTLVFIVHLVQVMLTYDVPSQECMEMEAEAEVEGKAVLDVYRSLRSDAGLDCTEMPSCWQLLSHVREATLPFLRCAALFYHHLTGVMAPISLHDKGTDEFGHLCNYLALPKDTSKLFAGPHTKALVKSWCCSRTLRERLAACGSVIKYPRSINRLIQLPKDYSELINDASQFTCPKSEADDSRAPTRCLVCGVMLCSQSYCCQTEIDGATVGAATQHTETCGAGAGIFLRVRDCQILLLCGRTKGCFQPAPYLDSYGETDQGLRRGNPLTLSPAQYDNIQKTWSTHNIPQTIARLMNQDSNSGFLAIEWNQL